jgi:hypothetical protein
LKILQSDPFVLKIWEEENRIRCGGCEENIQLDNRKPWSLHLQKFVKAKVAASTTFHCDVLTVLFLAGTTA